MLLMPIISKHLLPGCYDIYLSPLALPGELVPGAHKAPGNLYGSKHIEIKCLHPAVRDCQNGRGA